MSKPPITVLMTVYNGGEYLKSSVNSVLKQTFRDFELLIIDDCSTDRALEDIKKIKDSRIRIHHNENNIGQTRSLNVGLELAQGRYIARMDADDKAFPGWLEEQMQNIEKYPEHAVVSARVAVIDHKDKLIRILNTPQTEDEILLKSLIASPINHVGAVIKKDILLEMGGYDEQLRIVADYELWSKMLRKGCRLVCVSDVLVAVRFHDQSISVREKDDRACEETVVVMKKNISHFSKASIGEKESISFWELIYHPQALGFRDFCESIELFKKIYNGCSNHDFSSKEAVSAFIKNQIEVAYIKKIFSDIEAEHFQDISYLAKNYLKKEGLSFVIAVILMTSFSGKLFLPAIPALFAALLYIRTKLKLRCNPFQRKSI